MIKRDLIIPTIIGLGIFSQSNELCLNNNTSMLLIIALLLHDHAEIQKLKCEHKHFKECCCRHDHHHDGGYFGGGDGVQILRNNRFDFGCDCDPCFDPCDHHRNRRRHRHNGCGC